MYINVHVHLHIKYKSAYQLFTYRDDFPNILLTFINYCTHHTIGPIGSEHSE